VLDVKEEECKLLSGFKNKPKEYLADEVED
jgi:hypothetical protein